MMWRSMLRSLFLFFSLSSLLASVGAADGVSASVEQKVENKAANKEENVANLARSAAVGNSNIAAGAVNNIVKFGSQSNLGPPPAILSFEFPSPALGKEVEEEEVHFKHSPTINKKKHRQHHVPLHFQKLPDPLVAFSHLEYLHYVLDYLFSNVGRCGKPRATCDLHLFSKCTCVSPAQFTEDGRGNCNLGVTKADKQVWCYVDPKNGNPKHVCPDAVESTSRPGIYWSRVACITE